MCLRRCEDYGMALCQVQVAKNMVWHCLRCRWHEGCWHLPTPAAFLRLFSEDRDKGE